MGKKAKFILLSHLLTFSLGVPGPSHDVSSCCKIVLTMDATLTITYWLITSLKTNQVMGHLVIMNKL